MPEKTLYRYDGEVTQFGRVIDIFKCCTQAVSEARAKANLAFVYKKKNDLEPNAKIELPGRLEIVK